jgi:hypothetical protein
MNGAASLRSSVIQSSKFMNATVSAEAGKNDIDAPINYPSPWRTFKKVNL